MMYWLAAAANPRARILAVASSALAAVTAIELVKLVHQPVLDAFRLTLAGRLILGRYFSGYDLIAYAVAVVVPAMADSAASSSSSIDGGAPKPSRGFLG